jgi:hypothetical protein
LYPARTLVLGSTLILGLSAAGCAAQQVAGARENPAQTLTLPNAPSETLLAQAAPAGVVDELSGNGAQPYSSSVPLPAALYAYSLYPPGYEPQAAGQTDQTKPKRKVDLDANGNPVPLDRQQPKRILGFMPNFRTVSAGSAPPRPTFKRNFIIATHQSLDYSTFVFLFLTTLTAEGLNEHPVLGKGVDGFYAYAWRGFLDKTDGTYLSAFLLPSILHEDTRYYPLGSGHKIITRALYVISRQAVTRTYGGHDTPNIAGLGGKVLTQIISRTYYPSGATSFGVLAEKFGYSVMRDVGFSSIREFYPDIAAHYIRKHREKVARQQAAATTP